ncbi:peptide MFS transporter [candidate division KSB1 bacterium]|nr:peptide MFS transporter [candidate division KSB1 bacterium]
MFKNHPKGLAVLFFTEMWERFGFYLLLGIFVLYLTDTAQGGLGFSTAKAMDIYGTYIALVYLSPFIGGLLADRILGYRLSITIGGFLMGLGYLGLALPGMTAFWVSLFLIIFGNGFFKPNISTLVGNLYNTKEFSQQKDAGYNIFYMGINIGAFICNFAAAYLRNNYGWGYAFAAAGIGMFIGLAIFLSHTRHIREADMRKPVEAGDMPMKWILLGVFLPAAVFGTLGWMIPDNIFGSDSNDAFLTASLPIVVYFISLWVKASKKDRSPIAALLSIFGVVIIFWAIFHQNGSALTLWARDYTDRTMPAVIEPIADKVDMVQRLDTTPQIVPRLDEYGRALIDAEGNALTETGLDLYFRNLPQEKWPAEGKSLNLISTELFLSINPFFIVLLTPLLLIFFSLLRRRGKEPSTPGKISIGLFITSLSALLMIIATLVTHNGGIKASPLWLIGTYLAITIGEIFLSPMGLSIVSKLSPPRLTALMMGGWFLAMSIGNKLSGALASLWEQYTHKGYFFAVNMAGCLMAALVILVILGWLKRVMREHGQS